MKRMISALAFLLGLAAISMPAVAQDGELRRRGEQVMAMLRGNADLADMFTAEFLAQVPAAQLNGISQQLTGQYGPPKALRVDAQGDVRGIIHIETERGLISMNMVLEPQPPHKIAGLLVTNAQLTGDTVEAVVNEIRALPGQTAVAVAALNDQPPNLVGSHAADRPMAIGSTFKLFILAELSRQVQAGERRWGDVAVLSSRSLPSGMLQNFPDRSPVTLHTLAALMISISDNTASDELLTILGRENVERMMGTIGVQAPERNRPFLSTSEIFALKTAPAADQQAFIGAGETERRRLLATRYASIDTSRIDPAIFAGPPMQIDTLEWFASPADLVRTMDWFRRHGDEDARQILGISPGGPAALKQEFAYVGYKGGSEPGVINLTWLVRNRAGTWHAVTGSWNNPAAAVDEARFTGLMRRLLQLVR